MNKNEYDEIITILDKYNDKIELPLHEVTDIVKQISEKYDLIFTTRSPISNYKEIQVRDKSLNNIIKLGFSTLNYHYIGGSRDEYRDELFLILMSIYNYLSDPEKYLSNYV